MIKIESIWQDTPGILLEARKNSFEDVLEVFNSLSEKEKKFYSDDGKKKNNPFTVYTKVAYLKNTSLPIGFVDLDDSGKIFNNKDLKDLTIGIAVKKEYRGKGVSTYLMKEALKYFKNSSYQSMTYSCLSTNIASEKLALKCGFVYFWTNKDKNEKIYMITKAKWLDVIK